MLYLGKLIALSVLSIALLVFVVVLNLLQNNFIFFVVWMFGFPLLLIFLIIKKGSDFQKKSEEMIFDGLKDFALSFLWVIPVIIGFGMFVGSDEPSNFYIVWYVIGIVVFLLEPLYNRRSDSNSFEYAFWKGGLSFIGLFISVTLVFKVIDLFDSNKNSSFFKDLLQVVLWGWITKLFFYHFGVLYPPEKKKIVIEN